MRRPLCLAVNALMHYVATVDDWVHYWPDSVTHQWWGGDPVVLSEELPAGALAGCVCRSWCQQLRRAAQTAVQHTKCLQPCRMWFLLLHSREMSLR